MPTEKNRNEVTEKTWFEGNLWPPAEWRPIWFAPGGGEERALQAFGTFEGKTLDIGALRVNKERGGVWEIWWPKSPTPKDNANAGWVSFNPADPSMMAHANRYSRYGAGHSFGSGLFHGHGKVLAGEIRAKLVAAGMRVSEMAVIDVEFNQGLARRIGMMGGPQPADGGVGGDTGGDGSSVGGIGGPSNAEVLARLGSIEKKLDQVLAAIEKLK